MLSGGCYVLTMFRCLFCCPLLAALVCRAGKSITCMQQQRHHMTVGSLLRFDILSLLS